jgi:CRP/FNR family transcriptional regulator
MSALDRAAERFPFLAQLDAGLRAAFDAAVRPVRLRPGQAVCSEGDACGMLPLVLSGEARVYRASPEGRSLTLYRIEPGEACILTASCLISRRAFPADAEAVTEIEALAIPAADFRAWHDASPAWRAFVADLMARRFAEVVGLVESVAFQRLDERLAADLLAAGPVVRRTHEALADDLGSAREVVSRILKEWEREGLVALGRGVVEVRALDRLRKLAAR